MYAWRVGEKRQHRRVNLNLPVIYSLEGPVDYFGMYDQREYCARTLDFSEGGYGVIVKQHLPQDIKITLKFFVPESIGEDINLKSRIIRIEGVTCYCVPTKARNQYRMGIAFTSWDEDFDTMYFDLMCAPDSKLALFETEFSEQQ